MVDAEGLTKEEIAELAKKAKENGKQIVMMLEQNPLVHTPRTEITMPYVNVHRAEEEHLTKKEKQAVIVPVRTESKIPRNNPCPCGSGKKYKHCCIKN